MTRVLRITALAALLGVSSVAAAAPVDRELRMTDGEQRFERLGVKPRVHVTDPDVLSAEVLPSAEVLLQARGVGTATVFFHSDGKVVAWRVRVEVRAPDGAEPAFEAAEAACKEFERTGPDAVEVTIETERCRKAVLGLHPYLTAENLAVTFGAKALKAQIAAQTEALKEARPELAEGLKVAYMGATLMVLGSVPTVADLDAAVRALWSQAAARFMVDLSQVEIASGERP